MYSTDLKEGSAFFEYDKTAFFLKQTQTQTCTRYIIVASLYRILGTYGTKNYLLRKIFKIL